MKKIVSLLCLVLATQTVTWSQDCVDPFYISLFAPGRVAWEGSEQCLSMCNTSHAFIVRLNIPSDGIWRFDITGYYIQSIAVGSSRCFWDVLSSSLPVHESAFLTAGEYFVTLKLFALGTHSVDVSVTRETFAEVCPNTDFQHKAGGNYWAIPDHDTLFVDIDVPVPYSVTDVNVTVSLDHFRDRDIDLLLRSPMGTEVELTSDNGNNGWHYWNTVFDDEAGESVVAGRAPFMESYCPEGALASFIGENAFGVWKLLVIDDEVGYTGTLFDAWLCFEADQILPAELSGFEATPGDQAVSLEWHTDSECAVDDYLVFRDGQLVHCTPAVNSLTGAAYSWTESDLENGRTYRYLLSSRSAAGQRTDLGEASATPISDAAIITASALHQNHPNPFNPRTTITFDLAEDSNVELTVYDPLGRVVSELVRGDAAAGRHRVSFDGSDLPSGMYFVHLNTPDFRHTRKMALMK